MNNNIKTITKDELTTFKEVIDDSKYTESLIIPLSDTYKKTEEAKPVISLTKKKRKK